MEIKLTCAPSYTMAYCFLAADESVLVESGAMAAMSGGVRTGIGIGSGGVAKAAMRKVLGGESFFMGRYTADVHGAWVAVAPRYPGDVAHELLQGDALLVESGALLAVSESVNVDVKWAGVRSIVLREGATLLRCSGMGDLLIGSYGGIQRFTLAEREQLIVDTGHLVGFSDTIKPRVGALSSLTTSAIVGEGLVALLEGPGTVLLQTRAEQGLKNWLMPERSQNTR
jgi:uncharacterized protein (TIGR00266 family)